MISQCYEPRHMGSASVSTIEDSRIMGFKRIPDRIIQLSHFL